MMASHSSLLRCPPRHATPRTDRPTLGGRVAEIAKILGTELMPWQQYVADVAFEVDPTTGQLQYREVILTVPRQSGKTTLLLAAMVHRALGFGDRQKIVYTAQTRNDARRKWEDEHLVILERSPLARLFDVRKTNGSEAIKWHNGSNHSITSTTEKAGHGDTVDLGVIDEAFAQVDDRLEQALKPAMITRTQPQLWVVSTAGTNESIYLSHKVDIGRQQCDNTDGSIAYFEWSADPDADPADPDTWLSCMPALGHTISLDAIAADHQSMKPADFRRAYLNLRYEGATFEPVISSEAWHACLNRASEADSDMVFAVDCTPDRSSASIAVCSTNRAGKHHIEVVDNRRGTGWVVDRMVELVERWKPKAIVIDTAGAAGSFLPQLTEKQIEVETFGARQVISACGAFFDAVMNEQLSHRGQESLDAAVAGAKKRPLGDAWAWHRKDITIDISPLVACTLALWGFRTWQSEKATEHTRIPSVIDPWSA